MPDTLTRTLDLIHSSLSRLSREKKTLKVTYDVVLNQGGIRDASLTVTTQEKLREE